VRADARADAARTVAPDSLDTSRLLPHLRVLAADSMLGRRVGTAGGERARRYLLGEFRRIGLEPAGASYEHPFVARDSDAVRGVNLLGKITGTTRPGQVLVLSAHYDHVGVGPPVRGDSIYNGADDNASGTAALLVIAEHLRRRPPESTVLFAAFDGEEGGRRMRTGAQAFVAEPPVPREAIVLNVNLDMVSHSQKGELYAAGASHYPFLRAVLDSVAGRAPVRLLQGHDRPVPAPRDDWTFQSDQGAFHRAGIPFVYFGVEDHPDYHRPSDEVATITPAFFVGAVRTVADAVRTFDRGLDAVQRARAAGPRP
jgi:Zn-dependent M28 family amino/carboxypeptidase